MKQYAICFLGILLSYPTLAQKNSLAISYDDVSVGRNINLTFRKNLSEKWTAYAGLKYHINSQHFKNDFSVYTPYFKEFEASDIGQRAGAKAGLELMLYRSLAHCSFFAFWDVQYTRASVNTKNIGFAVDSFQSYHYEAHADITHSLENTLGIGAKFNIGERLHFIIKAGLGLNYYRSENPLLRYMYLGGNRRLPLPASRIISAGFEYGLGAYKYDLDKKVSVSLPYRSLQIAYNNVQVGRNYSLTYHQRVIANTYLYGGIKLHLNSKAFVDYSRMGDSYYFKQFRAENFRQSIGIRAGIEQTFPIRGTKAKLFGFYDFQLTHATVRNLTFMYYFYSGYSRASIIAIERYKDWQPTNINFGTLKSVTSFENTIGLGARLPVSEKIQFRIQGGIGYNFYKRPDFYESYVFINRAYSGVKFDAPRSEFSKMFSLGLEYSLDGR